MICRVASLLVRTTPAAPVKSASNGTPSIRSSSTTHHTAPEPFPRSLAFKRGLLLLSIPIPPSSWPPKLDLASELLSATSRAIHSSQIAMNAIYDGSGTQARFGEDEIYPARLFFPDGKRFVYPTFDRALLSAKAFSGDLEHVPNTMLSQKATAVEKGISSTQEILVCTHGARDCRCADRGGPLVDALREEIDRRGVQELVKVSEIAHVGGHKYAANAILLPSLDMLSYLNVSHAPSLISHLLSGRDRYGQMWSHWRGRYGLNEEQQARLWADVDPYRQNRLASLSSSDTEEKAERVSLRFKCFDGQIKDVQADIGESLLAAGKTNDLSALEGVCGGNLECATCHLYLQSTEAAPVPTASDEELDMLGYAMGYREEESRLGCQIKVTKELGEWSDRGGVIGLPRF